MRADLDALIARIEARDPEFRALVEGTFDPQRLREDADALRKRFPDPAHRPALFGLPVGIKDIYRVDGYPTRCGSRLPPDLFAGTEASTVTALKSAGALVVAKTVTTEFAGFAPGPTRNPIRPAHTPGGSSSGSAAGVAAGFFPAALGTQTIGSIIRPAAYCGIFGFKPSFGRIPTDGIVAFSPSADHVGVLTKNPDVAEDVLGVLIEGWQPAPSGSSPTLGVPAGPYLEQASPGALHHFAQTLDRLSLRGIVIREVPLFPDIDRINRDHWRLICGEVTRDSRALAGGARRSLRTRDPQVFRNRRGRHGRRAEDDPRTPVHAPGGP